MTQLLEIVRKLTDEERREVQHFAEFLLNRRDPARRVAAVSEGETPVRYEGWAGCLAHVHPEMSDAQFNKLILDEWTRGAED